MTHATFTPRTIRRGLLDLADQQPFTHALTLNTDRELSLRRLRSIFGTFCAEVDRLTHRKQRPYNIPVNERFLALGFPEDLETHAHVHAVADLRYLMRSYHSQSGLEQAIDSCWLRATRGAGSSDVQALRSSGFAAYAAKKARGIDPIYFISTDYHPC